jgi:hypothetical protein
MIVAECLIPQQVGASSSGLDAFAAALQSLLDHRLEGPFPGVGLIGRIHDFVYERFTDDPPAVSIAEPEEHVGPSGQTRCSQDLLRSPTPIFMNVAIE